MDGYIGDVCGLSARWPGIRASVMGIALLIVRFRRIVLVDLPDVHDSRRSDGGPAVLTVMLLAAMEKALLVMLALFGVVAAIGLYEAWSKKRGIVGWIVSVVTAIVGAVATMSVCVSIGDAMVVRWPKSMAGEMFLSFSPILVLVGAWLALRVVARFR